MDAVSTATREGRGVTTEYRWPTLDSHPLLKWSAIAAAILIPAWLVLARQWSLRTRAAVAGWILLFPTVLLAVSLLGASDVPSTPLPRPHVTARATASLEAPAGTASQSQLGSTSAPGASGSQAIRYGVLIAVAVALVAAFTALLAAVLLRDDGEFALEAPVESPLPAGRPAHAEHTPSPRNAREAIIRDYRLMELALAARGHPRSPWETSAEYAVTAARAAAGAQPQAAQLTGLFELARYSPHDIDEGLRLAADGSLAAILDDLARPAGGALEPGGE
ncbi:MAG TPA: DUF4129 domain-containing protein [Candidatus Dormibacteraeota bacterium]